MAAEQGRFTGKQINGLYHIEQRLGQGGMGEAYLATFLIHQNTPVVVKFLLDDGRGQMDQKARAGFEKEAATHAKLTHPNIVRFYRYGIYEEGNLRFPYIVMEYAEEGSVVHEVKRRGGLLPEEQSIDIVLQTGDALGYAHDQKVLHRDLKPHNLLLKKEYRSGVYLVLLSDFGITATAHRLYTANVDITKQEGIGTPAYMAAEQFEEKARIPSDIYSLGVITFELLSGSKPFLRDNQSGYYIAHKFTQPPTLEETRRSKGYQMTHMVGAMEEIVATALQKEPAQRYQSAGDFTEAMKVAQGKVKAEEEKQKQQLDMGAVKQVVLQEQARKLSKAGRILCNQEKYEAALALFEQACLLDRNSAYAWHHKGAALIGLKRYEEALKALKKAEELDPSNTSIKSDRERFEAYLHTHRNVLTPQPVNEVIEQQEQKRIRQDRQGSMKMPRKVHEE